LVGRSIADVFDMSYEQLIAASLSGRRAMWELRDHQFGRRYFASLVEGDGRSYGAIVPRAAAAHGNAAYAEEGSAAEPAVVRVAPGNSDAAMRLEDLAGDDPQMMRNLRNARRIADSCVSVMILGPTGSGKEVFARALHLASKRAQQAFVAINCAAIPESLIESELFGYAAGAFTGARREGMRGRILQSSGGTLFLDEIGDMPLLLQTRLLRVLEDQEVTPLGSESAIKVNLRVICASHRNLRQMLSQGEFRDDLYYRLNGITLELPPLAARRDKEALVRQCIAREFAGGPAASIEVLALDRLLTYDWPGNIRELRNTIRTALALCGGRIIRLGDLPDEITHFKGTRPASETSVALPADAGEASLASAERQVLIRVMEQHRWNMSHVAAQLGISRNTLYRKVKRHRIAISRRLDDLREDP
jgi:transcriptional regulator of acetoin/glycerol metabolism